MTHAPAPWKWKDDRLVDANGAPVLCDDASRVNDKLIESAPIMLEALEWISDLADLKHEEDVKLRSDSARTLRRIIDRAEAAIAQARGVK